MKDKIIVELEAIIHSTNLIKQRQENIRKEAQKIEMLDFIKDSPKPSEKEVEDFSVVALISIEHPEMLKNALARPNVFATYQQYVNQLANYWYKKYNELTNIMQKNGHKQYIDLGNAISRMVLSTQAIKETVNALKIT